MTPSYTAAITVQLLFLLFFSLPALCRLARVLIASSILLNPVGNGNCLLLWLSSPKLAAKVLCEGFI